jgi:hypothetical protein
VAAVFSTQLTVATQAVPSVLTVNPDPHVQVHAAGAAVWVASYVASEGTPVQAVQVRGSPTEVPLVV